MNNNQTKLIEKLEEQTKVMDHQQGEINKLKEVQEDYYDLLKQIAASKVKSNTINMYYILNHFTDALNYDDLMDVPLTEEEKLKLRELEPLAGSIHLIESRCIIGVAIDKRAIHCLDTARNKYLVRIAGKWTTDHRAKHIFAKAAAHMYKFYLLDPNDAKFTVNQIIQNQEALMYMDKNIYI